MAHDPVPEKTNPYRPAPGAAPPALVGRDGELAIARLAIAITKSGGCAQPIMLEGLRGMGKTALLRTCQDEIEQAGGIVLSAEAGRNFPLGYAFAQSIKRARMQLRRAPQKLLSALDKALDHLPQVKFDLPNDVGALELGARNVAHRTTSMLAMLSELNDEVHKHGRFLAISIDEIQDADIDKLRPIVTLVHETGGTTRPILMAGAGLPSLAHYLHGVRTYTERWRYLTLDLLSQEQSREALGRPARDHGVSYSPDALSNVAEATGGYPYFIQQFGSVAWEMRDGQRVTASSSRNAIAATRKMLDTEYYENQLRVLTPRELRYAIAMSELGSGPYAAADIAALLQMRVEQLSSVRNQLVKKGIVTVPAYGMLEFRTPLTDQYLRSHRDALERRAGPLAQTNNLKRSIERGR